jgi:aminoglycoside 2''-phosphotransferase
MDKTAVYQKQIIASEPTLNIQTVDLNQEGLVNDIVIINKAKVFRFPKHEWAVDHLWQESNCLALIRQHLDMKVPKWTVYDGEIVGTPFVGYDWIEGKPLQRNDILRLPERDQDALAAQLAIFLQQMHAIPMDKVESARIGRSVTLRTYDDWIQLYDAVQEKLFPHLMAFSKDWIHQHFAPIIADKTFMDCDLTFMNGDLAQYHLLYNAETRLLNGVIDFGTAGIGDPACDFCCLLDQYGETFLRRISHYYPYMVDLIERTRFWAGTLELQWQLGALRYPDDPSWMMVHIGRGRDVLPIGSGWDN